MKKVSFKIGSVLMAFVVLFSTMSFTISSHFCGDSLVDKSYIGKAKNCGMDIKNSTNFGKCLFTKEACCNDDFQKIIGQNHLNNSSPQTNLTEHSFQLTTALITDINFDIEIHDYEFHFIKYIPPLLVKKIQKLDEVYLI